MVQIQAANQHGRFVASLRVKVATCDFAQVLHVASRQRAAEQLARVGAKFQLIQGPTLFGHAAQQPLGLRLQTDQCARGVGVAHEVVMFTHLGVRTHAAVPRQQATEQLHRITEPIVAERFLGRGQMLTQFTGDRRKDVRHLRGVRVADADLAAGQRRQASQQDTHYEGKNRWTAVPSLHRIDSHFDGRHQLLSQDHRDPAE